MIALVLLAAAATQSYNARMIGAGAPATVAAFAKDARACGYKVSIRPWRDGDIVPKPAALPPDADIALTEKPIKTTGRRFKCFMDAEQRFFRSFRGPRR